MNPTEDTASRPYDGENNEREKTDIFSAASRFK